MDQKRAVAELREKIAKLDLEIVERLDTRARLSREIHARADVEPGVDVGETEWLARLEAAASGELPAESLRSIFRQIRAAARGLEQPVKVAYVGPEGGFCHQTAIGYFGLTANFAACVSPIEALDEVARGRAAFAVFPFESSVDGLVQSSVTALAETELVLVGERALPATYHLMSSETNLGDIEKVYATAIAHAACQRFLDQDLPRASVIDVRSPVVAAQLAREERASAAILPEPTGRAANLELLRGNVGDASDLRFRYGIAGSRPAMRSGNDVTCLLIGVDDSPGSLFSVLRHFAERGINLKKLQSRPVQRENWDYVFYVEIGGHVTDRPVVTALEAIKRNTKYLRVLGSFPVSAV
ncbi:MAG TPA: prephenate dehydratase domain-containing protein [Polyangiaceae bacterium]|nr:prephenate dehydratase domain-containing protein [Polyangiaceae bacterium]